MLSVSRPMIFTVRDTRDAIPRVTVACSGLDPEVQDRFYTDLYARVRERHGDDVQICPGITYACVGGDSATDRLAFLCARDGVVDRVTQNADTLAGAIDYHVRAVANGLGLTTPKRESYAVSLYRINEEDPQ